MKTAPFEVRRTISKGTISLFVEEDIQSELMHISKALCEVPKGILMINDSPSVMAKRFKQVNIDSTDQNQRDFRHLMINTDLNDFFNGITIPSEYIFEKVMLPEYEEVLVIEAIKKQGLIPGVRGYTEIEDFYGFSGEYLTLGLDDIQNRLKKYKGMGFQFANWRIVYRIGTNKPSCQAMSINASLCARFAALCQQYRLVPLIGIEMFPDPECTLTEVTKSLTTILCKLHKALYGTRTFFEGLIIQSTFVIPGEESNTKCTPNEIVEATLHAFSQTILAATHGIHILPGPMPEEEFTLHFNAIFDRTKDKIMWPITFAFEKSLFTSTLYEWQGNKNNETLAQTILRKRAKAMVKACAGKYTPGCIKFPVKTINLDIRNTKLIDYA